MVASPSYWDCPYGFECDAVEAWEHRLRSDLDELNGEWPYICHHPDRQDDDRYGDCVRQQDTWKCNECPLCEGE